MNPFESLEKLIADGRIFSYEVSRESMNAYCRVNWMEYDADSPHGSPCCANGYGPSIAYAVNSAIKQIPKAINK